MSIGDYERSGIIALALGMFAFIAPGRAQDDPERSSRSGFSQEDILALIEEVEKNHIETPSILGGIDLKRAPAEVKKVASILRSTRIDLMLDQQSVEDTIDLLRRLSGLNFVISAGARKVLAAPSETGKANIVKPGAVKVSIQVRDLPLENALNLLALRLEEFRFTIAYGAILLVHKDEYRPKTVLKVYSIQDLVRPIPDFPAPALALTSPDEKP